MAENLLVIIKLVLYL